MSQRPRVPLRSLQSFEKSFSELFFCPSCAHWRLSRPARRQWSSTSALRRPISNSYTPQWRSARITTSAATNAINAPSTTPPQFRELHAALEDLKTKAPEYVNLSQLSLALRGLEPPKGDGAVVRIAILGLGRQDTARKLARALLADPLADKGKWEDEVMHGIARTDSGAVLLKYGEEGAQDAGVLHGRSQLYTEIAVPSTLLKRHNIEILVSGISVDVAVQLAQDEMDRPSDALLVPTLEAGASGMVTMVRYPVHKALVLGEGLGSSVAFGRFMGGGNGSQGEDGMVGFAVDMPGSEVPQTQEEALRDGIVALDVGKAGDALDKFRKSTEFATEYERKWLHSGVPILHQWLINGAPAEETTGNSALKPVLRDLISHLASSASASLNAATAAQLSARLSSTTPPTTVNTLEIALRDWSRKAHTELRDVLDEAFASKNWHKIGWWKLLWRVDDVTMVAEEVLERRWLPKAEKSGLWLMGRIEEAGLLPDVDVAKIIPPPVDEGRNDQSAASTAEAGVSKPLPEEKGILLLQISNARERLSSETVPGLQATAQRLLLESLSTVSLSSALSALLWLSSSFSVLEAASVAALGSVWALRRLQRRWEGKREQWEGDVREEGRVCLKGVEDSIARVLESAKTVRVVESEDVRDRKLAREAVERVGEALKELRQ
ncbi:hypothetical protein NA57DRAFT_67553 [Rhizodiscina lignyota]|uniref:Mmc1 C-terminal domain-containing protein n=1 Tax=Rhizodiscina lignyota TaxID=1504668 RepID=A0A9P4IAT6_9PEZI|nr:hypothetical protein NA57DRAFT_67553 [Rhizodiscina lignyota]